MLRIFSFFRDWAMAHDLDPAHYRITITPLTAGADARLKDYWSAEVMRLVDETEFGAYEGKVFEVPFRIESFK